VGLGALYRGLAVGAMGIVAFDTGANVLVALATTYGAAGIVAVLSVLYPVVTVALASSCSERS
jgi:drug/metabolite transporter (DMT)-like permease